MKAILREIVHEDPIDFDFRETTYKIDFWGESENGKLEVKSSRYLLPGINPHKYDYEINIELKAIPKNKN